MPELEPKPLYEIGDRVEHIYSGDMGTIRAAYLEESYSVKWDGGPLPVIVNGCLLLHHLVEQGA